MRTVRARSAMARSSSRERTFSTLMPGASSISNMEITGPFWISTTRALILKLSRVRSRIAVLSASSSSSSSWSISSWSSSRSRSGKTYSPGSASGADSPVSLKVSWTGGTSRVVRTKTGLSSASSSSSYSSSLLVLFLVLVLLFFFVLLLVLVLLFFFLFSFFFLFLAVLLFVLLVLVLELFIDGRTGLVLEHLEGLERLLLPGGHLGRERLGPGGLGRRLLFPGQPATLPQRQSLLPLLGFGCLDVPLRLLPGLHGRNLLGHAHRVLLVQPLGSGHHGGVVGHVGGQHERDQRQHDQHDAGAHEPQPAGVHQLLVDELAGTSRRPGTARRRGRRRGREAPRTTRGTTAGR